jgi:hypothetical protein
MINRKLLAIVIGLSFFAVKAFPQNNTPYFVSQVNGTNVIIVKKSESMPLSLLAKEYSVSEELLSVFNNVERSESITANQEIVIPLTETNFIKDKLVATNSNLYRPLYHQGTENQSIQAISKMYLLPATKLLDWNKIKTSTITDNTQLLVGWLRTTDPLKPESVSPITAGKKMVSSGINEISTGSQKVIEKVGDGLTDAGRRIKSTAQKLSINNFIDVDSLAYSAEDIDTTSIMEMPLVYQLSTEVMNADNLQLVNKTGEKIKTGFQSVKKSFKKLVDKKEDADAKPKKSTAADKQKIQAEEFAKNKAAFAAEEAAALQKEQDKKEAAAKKLAEQMPTEPQETIYDLAKQNAQEAEIDNLTTEPKLTSAGVNITRTVAAPPKDFKSGRASWFYVGSTGGNYYIFTNFAPKGSNVNVFNSKTNKKIVAKVLGGLTAAEVQAGQIGLISENAKEDLGSKDLEIDITLSVD